MEWKHKMLYDATLLDCFSEVAFEYNGCPFVYSSLLIHKCLSAWLVQVNLLTMTISNTHYTRHGHNSHSKTIQNCWKVQFLHLIEMCNYLYMDWMNRSCYSANGSIADTFIAPNDWRMQPDEPFFLLHLHHLAPHVNISFSDLCQTFHHVLVEILLTLVLQFHPPLVEMLTVFYWL